MCNICHDFGKVHPVTNGKVNYASLIFCVCQNEKAGQIACLPMSVSQAHYHAVRTNPAYRQELWQMRHEVEHEPSNAALYGQSFERDRQVSTPGTGPANLTPIRVALADLNNKVTHHIDAGKKKPPTEFTGIKE